MRHGAILPSMPYILIHLGAFLIRLTARQIYRLAGYALLVMLACGCKKMPCA
jgi:hypothetical protein